MAKEMVIKSRCCYQPDDPADSVLVRAERAGGANGRSSTQSNSRLTTDLRAVLAMSMCQVQRVGKRPQLMMTELRLNCSLAS